MNEFPIQESKIQRPELRDSTLRRDRLLDWLHAKIHHRVVFVTAEAGYGKTTLLADFARRTRLRTIWYRLDEEDRDWISVLNYLVAAGREVQPGFAPTTGALLRDLGSGGPAREAIIDTFVRELATFGGSGAVLVLDDFHLVDGAADVRALMREIVARGPERLTVVFASRRRPTIPLARLRALGELVELTAGDLRFDDAETERLFREAYGTPLEPDILVDLNRRTEGWAASLQLVQAAIRDRSTADIRAFVRSLSGAQAELHDYLAEEVVGDLEPELLTFLMNTSILQSVDPDLAAVVTGLDEDRVIEHAASADALGLLPDGARRLGASRYHPLVRDFLEARLRRAVGGGGIRELHRRVAAHAEARSWRLAAHHHLAAGDLEDLRRVLSSSTRSILGTGEFALAETYIDRLPADDRDPSFDMIRSRTELHHDRVRNALEHARAAFAAFPPDSRDPQAHLAMANLMAVEYHAGDLASAYTLGHALIARDPDHDLTAIGRATIEMLNASKDGSLAEYRELLTTMLETQEAAGDRRFAGITELNLAVVARARGDAPDALHRADRAIEALSEASGVHELPAAWLARAWALAHLGRWEEALAAIDLGTASPSWLARAEALQEAADIHSWYGNAETAIQLSDSAGADERGRTDAWRISRAQILIRLGRLAEARELMDSASPGALSTEVGHQSRSLFVRALLSIQVESPLAHAQSLAAQAHAQHQGARFWSDPARVLAMSVETPGLFDEELRALLRADPAAANLLAELVASRLTDLRPETVMLVSQEASRRPLRWRPALRATIAHGSQAAQVASADLLDEIGEQEDVATLRRLARQLRGRAANPHLGRQLARRLAPNVFVEDQGRISVRIGDRLVPGTSVRRRVLGLLCYLLTRTDLSATRDQVLDALWPDLEPDVAANSLNQTVYFLRRVFEPDYREDLSPGYVHHDSDVLWLDTDLVSSRTRFCRNLIKVAIGEPSPENVVAVTDAYLGRFALDFAYEEWAASYRDSLHAAYLDVVERAIRLDTHSGDFDRAIGLARRAVEVDPEAEHLELSLLRLYRITGAHSAAAEQYSHYSSVLRNELGVEPPTLESL